VSELNQMRQHGDFWVARSAVVVGDVQIGPECSIWHFVTIRGDVAPIRLGPRTVVQDGAILHCQIAEPLEIDGDVILGHRAVVHGRRIGRGSLIGIGAILLDGVRIGRNCIVAAGTVVPPGMTIPDGHVVMGRPAEVVREVSPEEIANIEAGLQRYIELATEHTEGVHRRPF